MASVNMLEFFMEDIAVRSDINASSAGFLSALDDGYNVCSSCGIDIILEHDQQDAYCPACGSELVK
jgi:Zn finger protein HypA/HybF involved in hydrogenase expression